MGYREDIAAAKAQIKEVTNDTIIDTTLLVHATLVSNPPKGTPIDYGWASSSWFVGVGAPPKSNTGNLPASGASAVAGREAEQATLVARFASSYDYTSGQTVYITNNVPYINRLNHGWSDKSPAGFVEDAVQVSVIEINSR